MVKAINFKASTSTFPMEYDNREYSPAKRRKSTVMDDTFIQQMIAEKKSRKKEKSKEAWYKTGVCAQVLLALSFAAIALITVLKYKGASLLEKPVLQFKNFKPDDLPKIDSDSVNPKAKDFINLIKDRTAMDPKVAEYAGTKSAEQCVLFYGPSGTGKTFSAKLLANEIGAEYAEVDFPKIASPYVGQASINIRNVFEEIYKKSKAEPNNKFLIAFNEIDSMLIPMEKAGTNQSYVLENRTAFLNGLDLVKELKNVKIVGTTNAEPKSKNLDLAALSRFGNIFEVELPTKKEVIASLKWHLRNCKAIEKHKFFENNKSKVELFADKLVNKKYSQRDVEKLAENAQARFGVDISKKSDPLNEKFDIKYLEEAFKTKGDTTGSILNGDTGSTIGTEGGSMRLGKMNWRQRLLYFIFG